MIEKYNYSLNLADYLFALENDEETLDEMREKLLVNFEEVRKDVNENILLIIIEIFAKKVANKKLSVVDAKEQLISEYASFGFEEIVDIEDILLEIFSNIGKTHNIQYEFVKELAKKILNKDISNDCVYGISLNIFNWIVVTGNILEDMELAMNYRDLIRKNAREYNPLITAFENILGIIFKYE